MSPSLPSPDRARARVRALAARCPALAVLDFETTGLDQPAVIEVAVVGPGGPLYDALVAPGRPVPPESTAVHGITAAELAGAAPWAVHVPRLQRALDAAGATVLATWSGFEAEVLAFEAHRGAPALEIELVDLKRLYAELRGLPLPPPPARIRGASLWQAAAHYGVPAGTHRARQDCEATLAVWAGMVAEAAGG